MTDATQDAMILLVEDNPNDAELTLIGFKRNRMTNPIVHVKNGEEALGYLFCTGKFANRNPAETPLAVVLDLKLPKVSGLEVLRHIRENGQTRHLPVIVLTSSKEEQDITVCHELGVDAYLQKPVSFLDFAQIVKTIADILARLNDRSLAQISMER